MRCRAGILVVTLLVACGPRVEGETFAARPHRAVEARSVQDEQAAFGARLTAGYKVPASRAVQELEDGLRRDDDLLLEGQLSEGEIQEIAAELGALEARRHERNPGGDPCEEDYRGMAARRRHFARARGSRPHVMPRRRFMAACKAGLRCADPRVVNGRVVSCSGGSTGDADGAVQKPPDAEQTASSNPTAGEPVRVPLPENNK